MIPYKYFKKGAIVFFLFAVAGCFVLEHVLPYAGIKPMRNKPEDLLWLLPQGVEPENYGLVAQEMKIACNDSLSLSALRIEADSAWATVVLIHGISACKEVELERAKLLADMGCSSLLLDLRAHGQSEGEYCTFGYHEKFDLRTVADTLKQLFPHQPLGIWGASLGGAIALQTMAIAPAYDFGIVESTFDELNKVALEYGADWFWGLRSEWMVNHVLQKSGRIAQFDPNEVKPVLTAAKINRPVLFIHGDKDSRIPMWFGQRNFEACPAPGKRWLKVQGGGHNNLWKIAGDTLRAEVSRFLEEQKAR